MKIAVISDLHLGRGDGVDIFGHDDAEFLRFLDHLEDNFERIVLLGDVYEALTAVNPWRQYEEYEAAKQAHREVVARFDRPQYRYLHGNHDLIAAKLDGAATQLELKADGTRLLFCHGHGYDIYTAFRRRVSEFFAWVGGWVLRFGLKAMYRALAKIDLLIRGGSKAPAADPFQRWAIALAQQRNADVIVTGHTHVGVRAEHGDRLFLNSGSCSEGQLSYLSLDTRAGDYRLNTGF